MGPSSCQDNGAGAREEGSKWWCCFNRPGTCVRQEEAEGGLGWDSASGQAVWSLPAALHMTEAHKPLSSKNCFTQLINRSIVLREAGGRRVVRVAAGGWVLALTFPSLCPAARAWVSPDCPVACM